MIFAIRRFVSYAKNYPEKEHEDIYRTGIQVFALDLVDRVWI